MLLLLVLLYLGGMFGLAFHLETKHWPGKHNRSFGLGVIWPFVLVVLVFAVMWEALDS